MIALPARDDSYDYEFFGKQCDAIVLMNYDQHWLTSPPGPSPPRTGSSKICVRFSKSFLLRKSSSELGTMLMTGPLLQRKNTCRGGVQHPGSFAARRKNRKLTSNSTAIRLNPHYSYYDEHNHVHQVWMLDGVTAYNELRASERLACKALRSGGSVRRTLLCGPSGMRPAPTLRRQKLAIFLRVLT